MTKEVIVFRDPKGRILDAYKLTDLSPEQLRETIKFLSDKHKIQPQDILVSLQWGHNTVVAKKLWLKNLVISVKDLLAREYGEMDEKALKDTFKNLHRVPIAHSETEDGYKIQVYADLINLNFTTEVNRVVVECHRHQSYAMMKQDLKFFDFDTAIGDAETAWEKYQEERPNKEEQISIHAPA